MKFGIPAQNHMPMTLKKTKWKLEVKFQYGGRLFSETGNSNISARYSATWPNFSVQIDFDVRNCDTLSNRKPKVDIRRCCCHLENR